MRSRSNPSLKCPFQPSGLRIVCMIWNQRGSIWHRWDPHLHAPGTLLTDQFKGNWEDYFAAIEKSNPVIRALGVTDYFCIGTYKEMKKHKAAGRIPKVEFLFPNVEMRLDMKTAKNHSINIHLMFSPNDPQHEYMIERILGRLVFRFQEQDYACNQQELVGLGRAYDPKQTDEGGAYRAGANMFKVSFQKLQELFLDEQKWLSQNCIVAVAGGLSDGTSGLQDDSSFAAFRQEVERFADVIFASSQKQREFWLGKTPGADRKTIEEKYKALKPCMHGSDAHRIETVGAPAEKRYCWLKGDLAFETIRQAVLEPEYRVSIGETPPPGPSPSEMMRHVELKDAPFIATPKLPVNPGLVTIIGARGSGNPQSRLAVSCGVDSMHITAPRRLSHVVARRGGTVPNTGQSQTYPVQAGIRSAGIHRTDLQVQSSFLSRSKGAIGTLISKEEEDRGLTAAPDGFALTRPDMHSH